jgi:hypothetical protein
MQARFMQNFQLISINYFIAKFIEIYGEFWFANKLKQSTIELDEENRLATN